MISLNPITDCESYLKLLNSLFKVALVFASDVRGLLEKYFIYQVNVQSCRAVINSTFFIFSSVISCVVHTTFATYQNFFVSSLLMPLKIGSFIVFTMLNGGGRGGGLGEGVCGGGGGGGGLDGICVRGKPSVINWKTLHSEAFTAPSSSLEGGLINGVYSRPDLSRSLKSLQLHVALNIKEMA